MRRWQTLAAVVGIAMLAVACTEKPQTIGSRRSADQVPYAGTKTPYIAPDWTAGDEKSWKEQLKVRAQRGQNEYTRM